MAGAGLSLEEVAETLCSEAALDESSKWRSVRWHRTTGTD